MRDASRERKARALAGWKGKPRLLSGFRFLFLHLACGVSGVGVKSGLPPEERLVAGRTKLLDDSGTSSSCLWGFPDTSQTHFQKVPGCLLCLDFAISCFVSGEDHFCRLNNMSLIC